MAPPARRRRVPVGSISRVQAAGPEIGVGARREVERRLDQVRGGDGARRLFAIGRRPALPQPLWRVEAGRIAVAQHRHALARDAAQHGVGQALEMGQAALRQLHRCIDGGMRRACRGRGVAPRQAAGSGGRSRWRRRAAARSSRPAPRRSRPAGAASWPAAGARRRGRAGRARGSPGWRASASSSGWPLSRQAASTSSATRRWRGIFHFARGL